MGKYMWKPVKVDEFLPGMEDCCFMGLEEIEEIPQTEGDTQDFAPVSAEKIDPFENIAGTSFIGIDDFIEMEDLEPERPKKKQKVKKMELVASVKSRTVVGEKWDAFNMTELLTSNIKSLFPSPTEIQKQTLSHAFAFKDVIGCAETGSGKTLAFGIPILNYISLNSSINSDNISKSVMKLTALIITPTRELALQINKHLVSVAGGITKKIMTIVGGMSVQKQERLISLKPDIVIATPGRLHSLLTSSPEFAAFVGTTKFFVVDEADRMVEAGHFKHLDLILDSLYLNQNAKRQTFVFSATMINDNLQKTDGSGLVFGKLLDKVKFRDSHPVYVNLAPKEVTARGVLEATIDVLDAKEKDAVLYNFLVRYSGKSIVFVNSIDAIRRLVPIFTHLRLNVFPLHSEMQQKQRIKNLERFTGSDNAILIASDVASRGLDIPQVNHVIHYHLPRQADIYVHRAGRTGRGKERGVSIVLTTPSDHSQLKLILHKLKKQPLQMFPLDRSLMAMLNKRMVIAKEIDKVIHSSKKAEVKKNWFIKNAEECDLIYEDSEESGAEEESSRTKTKLGGLKQKLADLMAVSLIPKNHSVKYLTAEVVKNSKLECVNNMPTLTKKFAIDDLDTATSNLDS